MRDYNNSAIWWGYNYEPAQTMSAVQIMEAGSLDSCLLAILWLMLEHRSSLIVAGPTDPTPGVGKTTTATALLDFLPAETTRVYARGLYEDFSFVSQTNPQETHILVNEISDHLRSYMWGSRVAKLFELLDQGYGLISSMHADTINELIEMLEAECSVKRSLLGNLTLVAHLKLVRVPSLTRYRLQRRIVSLHYLEKAGNDCRIQKIASWDKEKDQFTSCPAEHIECLAERIGLTPQQFQEEIHERQAYLVELSRLGQNSALLVRQAIAEYRAWR